MFARQLSVANEGIAEQRLTSNLRSLQSRGSSKIAVTGFITQYDEIRQVMLENQPVVPTQSMVLGTVLHEALEKHVELDPSQLRFDPTIKEGLERDAAQLIDFVDKFVFLANGLNSKYGVIRELPLRGSPPGGSTVLRGVVDCLYMSSEGIVISETKTTKRLTSSLLRIAYHQALTYHWLLTSLIMNDSPFIPRIQSLFQSESDMSIAYSYLEAKSRDLTDAAKTLRRAGLAPYVNLHFLKSLGDGQHEEQVFEAPYDHETLLQVLQSREDFFQRKRGPFGFRLFDAEDEPVSPAHIDSKDLDLSNSTAAERSALRV